jgi:hypothetical protein
MKKTSIEIIFCTVLLNLSLSLAFAQPIKPYPANPHLFIYQGRPILLITSDELYGAVINSEFDYVTYLDKLKSKGMNFVRIYPGAYIEEDNRYMPGNPLGARSGKQILPWARTTTPGAHVALGGYKYDLDKWDEAYFSRLNDFCLKAFERGIIIEICFFNGQYNPARWKNNGGWFTQPLYKDNNIQGVGTCSWDMVQSLTGDPGLVLYHEKYVKEITKRLNDFDNVMFHIADEPWMGVKNPDIIGPWIGKMIEAYTSMAVTLPKKHLLGQTVDYLMSNNAADFSADSRIGYIDLEYVNGLKDLRNEYVHNKPLVLIETSIYPLWYSGDKISASRVEAWEFMLGGCAGFMQLNSLYTTYNPSASGTEIDTLLDVYVKLGNFMESLNYPMMKRDTAFIAGGVPSGAFATSISEPGKQYAFYIHHSVNDMPFGTSPLSYKVVPGAYQEKLTFRLPAGSYKAEWVNPEQGSVIRTDTIKHQGGILNLNTPQYTIDVALKLTIIAPVAGLIKTSKPG